MVEYGWVHIKKKVYVGYKVQTKSFYIKLQSTKEVEVNILGSLNLSTIGYTF